MQLIVILLATVSILTLLSGAIVFFGSTKGDRVRSAWFFLAAIFATIWMTSISIFLTAGQSMAEIIDWHVKWTFISVIIIDVAFLSYIVWREKYGKFATFFFLAFSANSVPSVESSVPSGPVYRLLTIFLNSSPLCS